MGTSNPLPYWEWWIVIYFFVGGLGGAAYAVACLLDVLNLGSHRPVIRIGWALAVPVALISAVCLVLDLGRPERFLYMLVDIKNSFLPNPKLYSPISMGSYILSAFGLFGGLHLLRLLHDNGWLSRVKLGWIGGIANWLTTGLPGKVTGLLGFVFGSLLAGYTSVLLSTTFFPAWSQNPLLGVLFVASAVSTGMAAIALLLSLRGDKVNASTWTGIKSLDNFAIIVELAALVATLTLFATASAPFLRLMPMVMLIGGTIMMGLLLPLWLQWKPAFAGEKSSVSMTIATSLLVLLGGLILRTIIVMAPQGFV